MKYIDVSEHQGVIDFTKVKGNVDGVIVRVGYGKGNIDKQFERNIKECNRLGIPCGAYWFSYAKNVPEAKAEADAILKAIAPYRLELPISYDFEYDSVTNAQKCGVNVTKALASDMVRAFCNAIEAAGYWALNYANPDFLSRYFDTSIPQRYGLWLASWPKNVNLKKPPRTCAIWQWGGTTIPGISGSVDTNESYTDFAKLISENGMNHLKDKPSIKDEAVKWAAFVGIECSDEVAIALFKYHKMFGRE